MAELRTLSERLNERKQMYLKFCKVEKFVDELLLEVDGLIEAEPMFSVYEEAVYIYINGSLEHPEDLMIDLVPAISAFFDYKAKWTTRLDTDKQHFNFYASTDRGIRVNVIITLNPSDSCIIQKIPTGRTHTVDKFVKVEEPEYKTIISCPEGD